MSCLKILPGLRALACMVFLAGASLAASEPSQAQALDGQWTLLADASKLRFQTVKNTSVVESSGFATVVGSIQQDGTAQMRILLDSVDTKIDLRNVRMRFLLFETFKFPEAVITTKLNPRDFDDLGERRRKTVSLDYTLELHGVSKAMKSDVQVTLLGDDMVAVSTSEPISVAAADFNLSEGIKKLEAAANVTIIPSATVTFDFVFKRGGNAAVPKVALGKPVPVRPANAALETETFDLKACLGRFEILSRTGNIYFASGSSRLDRRSTPLLNSLVDIINRCPDLVVEVSGHTDSDGSAAANQRLSEARARAVSDHLAANGVPRRRIVSVGYGEQRPVAPNDSAANKNLNRRIEFAAVNG